MQENLTKWKEVEDLASISLRVFPSDWELIRTKPAEYADRIERRKIRKTTKSAPQGGKKQQEERQNYRFEKQRMQRSQHEKETKMR